MRKFRYGHMKEGWFIGNFEPSVYKTELFEVAMKIHEAGEYEEHMHPIATEINLVLFGKVKFGEDTMRVGDIFIVDPGEWVRPVFLGLTHILCVKVPSIPTDKVVKDDTRNVSRGSRPEVQGCRVQGDQTTDSCEGETTPSLGDERVHESGGDQEGDHSWSID